MINLLMEEGLATIAYLRSKLSGIMSLPLSHSLKMAKVVGEFYTKESTERMSLGDIYGYLRPYKSFELL